MGLNLGLQAKRSGPGLYPALLGWTILVYSKAQQYLEAQRSGPGLSWSILKPNKILRFSGLESGPAGSKVWALHWAQILKVSGFSGGSKPNKILRFSGLESGPAGSKVWAGLYPALLGWTILVYSKAQHILSLSGPEPGPAGSKARPNDGMSGVIRFDSAGGESDTDGG
ncbi:hypothetical protein SDJN03_09459, partial [Cucurbita argyrosperma subsp. sororia]